MFVYANDPERIKNQINELRCKLDDLSSEAAQIANFIILTTERPKNIPSMLFIKDYNFLISKGMPEDEAFEDARQNIGLSKEMATWALSRIKNHKKGLRKYAQAYFCQHLRQKGYSYNQISKSLDMSVASVKRYLKKEIQK